MEIIYLIQGKEIQAADYQKKRNEIENYFFTFCGYLKDNLKQIQSDENSKEKACSNIIQNLYDLYGLCNIQNMYDNVQNKDLLKDLEENKKKEIFSSLESNKINYLSKIAAFSKNAANYLSYLQNAKEILKKETNQTSNYQTFIITIYKILQSKITVMIESVLSEICNKIIQTNKQTEEVSRIIGETTADDWYTKFPCGLLYSISCQKVIIFSEFNQIKGEILVIEKFMEEINHFDKQFTKNIKCPKDTKAEPTNEKLKRQAHNRFVEERLQTYDSEKLIFSLLESFSNKKQYFNSDRFVHDFNNHISQFKQIFNEFINNTGFKYTDPYSLHGSNNNNNVVDLNLRQSDFIQTDSFLVAIFEAIQQTKLYYYLEIDYEQIDDIFFHTNNKFL